MREFEKETGLSAEELELFEYLLEEEGLAETSPAAAIPRRERREDAPLSFAQQRLWFLQQLRPGSAAYNVARADWHGASNAAALGRSLSEIARRHESCVRFFAPMAGVPRRLSRRRPTVVAARRPDHAARRRVIEALGTRARGRDALRPRGGAAAAPDAVAPLPPERTAAHHAASHRLRRVVAGRAHAGVGRALRGSARRGRRSKSCACSTRTTRSGSASGSRRAARSQWSTGGGNSAASWRVASPGRPAARAVSPRLIARPSEPEIEAGLTQLCRRSAAGGRDALHDAAGGARRLCCTATRGRPTSFVGTPVAGRDQARSRGSSGSSSTRWRCGRMSAAAEFSRAPEARPRRIVSAPTRIRTCRSRSWWKCCGPKETRVATRSSRFFFALAERAAAAVRDAGLVRVRVEDATGGPTKFRPRAGDNRRRGRVGLRLAIRRRHLRGDDRPADGRALPNAARRYRRRPRRASPRVAAVVRGRAPPAPAVQLNEHTRRLPARRTTPRTL